MGPQIPELLQSDFGNVDNVATLADRRGGIRPIGNGGAERQDKATHVFVQREQAQHFPRDFAPADIFSLGLLVAVRILLVGGQILVLDIGDFEDVDRNPAVVSPTRPLRVEPAGLFVFVNVDAFVETVQLILLPPVFRRLELSPRVFGDELSRAEVAEESFVVMGGGGVGIGLGRLVVSFLLAERLELLEGR